jgi:hypothetical protein
LRQAVAFGNKIAEILGIVFFLKINNAYNISYPLAAVVLGLFFGSTGIENRR